MNSSRQETNNICSTSCDKCVVNTDLAGAARDSVTGWRLVVGHADALADGERLVTALRGRLPVIEAQLVEVGPAVGAHAGPGTLVVGLQPAPA